MSDPGLFGLPLTKSNRDFRLEKNWGKNCFNSSFPASLVCYMDSKNMGLNYLTLDKDLKVSQEQISGEYLFGRPPLSDDLYFNFEAVYAPFETMVLGQTPRVDLVTKDISQFQPTFLRALEIKLTALPDSRTHSFEDSLYGSELVIRPDSIVYLALNIASLYKNNQKDLALHLEPVCDRVADWKDSDGIRRFKRDFCTAIDTVLLSNLSQQTPFLLQPIWKTVGRTAILAENCFDVFVWSDMAFTRLFVDISLREENRGKITRHERSIYWLIKMLYDFARDGQIDPDETINGLIYGTKSDKAFSVAGTTTNYYMASQELRLPRINKAALKEIILGGGQEFLSPERRLDAAILSTPGLF